MRRRVAALVALVVATAAVPPAAAADPVVERVMPGNVVTVRLAGTPKSFTLADRVRPFQKPIRIYLVRAQIASKVRSRFDRRLHFVGRIVPDRRLRGLLTFRAPALAAGVYAVAGWWPPDRSRRRAEVFFIAPGQRLRIV